MSLSKQISVTCLCILLASFLSSCAHHGIVPEAIPSRDYHRAFNEYLPLALKGNCEAEYKVGYMYYYGLGVNLDQDQGRDWIRLSAQQNCINGVIGLREITRIQHLQSRF